MQKWPGNDKNAGNCKGMADTAAVPLHYSTRERATMRKILAMLALSVSLLLQIAFGASAGEQQRVAAPQTVVIDVRTEAEWKAGHLEGAVLIPHDRIEQGITGVAPDKKTRIYLYCRTGRRTGLALEALKKAGYQDLVNLQTMEKASQELKRHVVK